MKPNENINSKEELSVFILLYCANADFKVTRSEFKYINSKIDKLDFYRLSEIFNAYNDYQIINKIQSSFKKLNYSKEDKEYLLKEIRELINLESTSCFLKLIFFRGLKRLFYVRDAF